MKNWLISVKNRTIIWNNLKFILRQIRIRSQHPIRFFIPSTLIREKDEPDAFRLKMVNLRISSSHASLIIMKIETTPEYIDLLNKAVAREIQVSVQYMIQHTKMEKLLRRIITENIVNEETTYHKFGDILKKFAIEEMKHLGTIMERIYLLGGDATTKPSKIEIGETMKEMAILNVKAEEEALELYDSIIKMAGKLGDRETRRLFVKIYSDEEEHLIIFNEYIEMEDEPQVPDPPESEWRSIFTQDYIDMLNEALWSEISAIIQYTNQHEKASKDKHRIKKEPLEVITTANKASIISDLLKPVFMEEMEHFEHIAERIFEVDREALANVKPLPEIGAAPDSWIRLDRDAEDYAITLYRKIISKANELGDITTKKLFEDILMQEEEHYWTFDEYL